MANLTRAQMAALLGDNTTGDITAEDIRNIVNSVLTLAEDVPVDGKYSLDGVNPVFKMGVLAGGIAAQMQVIDKETGREVATMEWHKATQTFNFVLFDKSSGVVKNSLSITPDGEATLNGHAIYTSKNRTYDYQIRGIQDTGNPVLINQDTYKTVVELDVGEARDADVYELKINASFKYSSTARSAYFQLSTDGGSTFSPFARKEPKDTTDYLQASVDLPISWTGGIPHIVLQAKCENASDTLTIDYASIVLERKS